MIPAREGITTTLTAAPEKKALEHLELGLLFTRNVSLRTWADNGSFEREVALYRRLVQHVAGISFVTYGGGRDLEFTDRLQPIRVLPAVWHRWRFWTLRRLLREQGDTLRRLRVLKTNQIPGAEIALELKRRFGQKLIARSGYPYSRNVEYEGRAPAVVRRAAELEREVFEAADLVVMTSPRNRSWAIDRHALPSDKVRVVPNYVETDVFSPSPGTAAEYDLVHVGRASPEKNVTGILAAARLLKARGMRLRVLLIGGSSEDATVRRAAEGLDVMFAGTVANRSIPDYLRRCRAFVLSSLYEGHPKALLEAMGCGVACIGSNVVGVRDEIEHLVTGYLCEPDAESLAAAIRAVLDDEALRRRLGENARRYVVEHYALDRVVALELEVLTEVLRR